MKTFLIICLAFVIAVPAVGQKQQIQLIYPSEGSTFYKYGYFYWKSVPGVKQYKLDIYEQKDKQVNVFSIVIEDTVFRAYPGNPGLWYDRNYYWQVCPVNDSFATCSKLVQFKYYRGPYLEITKPVDGAVNVELDPYVSWDSDYDGRYEFSVISIYKNDSLIFQHSPADIPKGILEHNTTYTIQIDEYAWSSHTWDRVTFTTKVYDGSYLKILEPINNAVDVELEPEIKWSHDYKGSVLENIIIYKGDSAIFSLQTDSLISTFQVPKGLLNYKSTYSFKISFDSSKKELISATSSFTTRQGPFVRILYPNENSKDVELEPELKWKWECDGAYVTTDIMIFEGGRDSLLSNLDGFYPFGYKVPKGLLKENTTYLFDIGIVTKKDQVRGEVEFTTGKFSDIHDKVSNKRIDIFPQPVFSGDVLTIASEEGEGAEHKLYNLMGIELNVGVQREGDKLLIETAGLAPGVYILEVGGVRKKVVVM